jgi:acetyl-CoA carboxylase biotin carboxyl carrier protein
MLKVQEIRELIKLVDQSSLDEFVYEFEGSKIKMKKNGTEKSVSKLVQTTLSVPEPVSAPIEVVKPESKLEAAAVQEAAHEEVNDQAGLHKIVSPMVGTFYQSSSPDVEAYVKQGTKVSKDSIVCIVEAMKLFNEIEAEINGEIVEILAKDGQLVEYGQPLFLVKPE